MERSAGVPPEPEASGAGQTPQTSHLIQGFGSPSLSKEFYFPIWEFSPFNADKSETRSAEVGSLLSKSGSPEIGCLSELIVRSVKKSKDTLTNSPQEKNTPFVLPAGFVG